jgi:hypothetical protein
MAPAGADPMDMTMEMLGEDEIAMRQRAARVGPARYRASLVGEPAVVGDEFTITVSDDVLGDYDETFVGVEDGAHGIILIEKAAYDSFDGTSYHVPNATGG